MKAPRRLLDDPTLAPHLRADLERVLAVPEPYDLTRGETQLAAALAIAAPLGEAGAALDAHVGAGEGVAQASSAAALGIPVTLGVVAAAALAIAVTLFAIDPPPETPAKPQPPDTASPPPAQLPAEATPAPAIDTADRVPTERGPADADLELRRETAQLGRIKLVLERNPARAYALAQSGHREFARGMLREEREALAVLALWNMGRDGEAQRRAEAFLARYPNSAVRGQVEQRLARARRSDAKAP